MYYLYKICTHFTISLHFQASSNFNEKKGRGQYQGHRKQIISILTYFMFAFDWKFDKEMSRVITDEHKRGP